MGDHGYVLAEVTDAPELERLRLLEAARDSLSLESLDQVGVAAGWKCLEVGAGAGSVARWLGHRVTPTGSVLATDIDTRFLVELPPNVEVRRHDIVTDDLPAEHFDLVHCRLLLIHLPDVAGVLQRMVAALRPGGWLAVEELDYALMRWAGHPEAEWTTEFTHRLHQRYADETTMDVFLGRRLPEELLQLGLVNVDARGVTKFGRGDERGGEIARYRMAMANLRARSLGLGFSEDELDRLDAVLASPSISMFGYLCVASWGQKPKPPGS